MKERSKFPISVQLLLENQDKILLMKRKNTGYEDGKYSLPGGHVEANEEIRKALVREAKEEIGINIKREDLKLGKEILVNDLIGYKIVKGKKDFGEVIDIYKTKSSILLYVKSYNTSI